MFISIDRESSTSLQDQIRSKIVAAIITGKLIEGDAFPSSRVLAQKNGVSRTTVVLVYEKLVEDGFLISKNRSGYFIANGFSTMPAQPLERGEVSEISANWNERFILRPSLQRNIVKPQNWQKYKYPFVYGQPDPALFPLAAWRECSRQAMSEISMRSWASDAISEDDPALITEIKSKLLPRRGIFADDSEILITSGAQNGLYLLASLLLNGSKKIAIEDPGYPDARNIFALHGAKLIAMQLDGQGPVFGSEAMAADYFFVTPSHQSPTTITMSQERRNALIKHANLADKIILEDDFESDFNYLNTRLPALKAEDTQDRVIYLGSLSKSMFPGLRLGYIVANKELISELRSLRRLMLRHVPSNNQRTTSLFISLGHHESYLRKLNEIYAERSQIMKTCLEGYFPEIGTNATYGGTSYWLQGADSLDADKLSIIARDRGIVIEPGSPHFFEPEQNRNYLRLGFSSINTADIKPGLKLLSDLMR